MSQTVDYLPRRARRRLRVDTRPFLTGSLFVAFAVAGVALLRVAGQHAFAWYGALLASLLGIKLFLSILPPRRWGRPPTEIVVGVVVPIFNEDWNALSKCLAALEAQSRPADLIVLVDDHSTDRIAAEYARRWAKDRPHVFFAPLKRNVGKRHAQAVAFRHFPQVNIWCTVDSDTVLEPDAIYQGLRPFNDPRVMAATGTVLALNELDGLLPTLIDLRYANAFLGERAAQSRLGAVLCCCGSLSFFRAEVIRANLDDWLSQKFLGKPATFGDDRRLTRYALDAGLVVLARDSLARTAVPVKVSHYLRQQARWGRSFWRESYLMLKDGSYRRLAWWLTLIEVFTTIVFSVGMLSALVIAPLSGNLGAFGSYIGWVAISAWARSVHLFVVKGRHRTWRTLLAFMLAPMYGFLSLFVLLPLRFWSLITLKSSNWGTRKTVEFSIEQVPAQRQREPASLAS